MKRIKVALYEPVKLSLDNLPDVSHCILNDL